MEETGPTVFCLDDIEKIGREKMDAGVAKYVYGGADQHQAVSRNRNTMRK